MVKVYFYTYMKKITVYCVVYNLQHVWSNEKCIMSYKIFVNRFIKYTYTLAKFNDIQCFLILILNWNGAFCVKRFKIFDMS